MSIKKPKEQWETISRQHTKKRFGASSLHQDGSQRMKYEPE
jgi:hypothetical protein